ncbi:putative ankyrin repeat protein [Zancudomyces culisetae]|uniref:Putative ankyrin repeat protein n=1 Tax=Zancudomyces culisetae TaxID=1213189 RepID=A0A1R1PNG3_ZANCU|nr:putative ankyrin repeat protein [Zancudomyces culisetae]|eukprot:OMH82507.1 putative ankyrin repeat protein [Zancudomyces culisetae]
MYYISQQVSTASKYIVNHFLSEQGAIFRLRLRDIFERYTRIGMNEDIGMLVLGKIKNLDYRIAVELAFNFRWRVILKMLLKMYLVIDKNALTGVYENTYFVNEGECFDINIGDFLSYSNKLRLEMMDVKIFESTYVRSLFRASGVSESLMWNIFYVVGECDIEMLIDICNIRFDVPLELRSHLKMETICVDNIFMTCCIFLAIRESCRLNDLESLKRILNLERNTNLPFELLRYVSDAKGVPIDERLDDFVGDYGYEEEIDLLIYTLCTYYSFEWGRKEFISYLEDNYSSSRHAQIMFDVATYQRSEVLVKKNFFNVEPNAGNVEKVTEMAYDRGNVDLIRFLLNNSDNLKGDLDENALKTAIKKGDCELAQEIINKYPKTLSVSCLEEAVKTRDRFFFNVTIGSGVDLTKPELYEYIFERNYGDKYMVRLLLENGASLGSETPNTIKNLCSIKNYEIVERLLDLFDKDTENAGAKPKTPEIEIKVGTRLTFNKIIPCLFEANLNLNKYYLDRNIEFEEVLEHLELYEELMMVINAGRKNINDTCAIYFSNPSGDTRSNQITRTCYNKLLEIIEYIVKNNLQSKFENTEYDEINGLGYGNNSEVLNDGHYELVKAELVNRNFEILKIIIEYGADINSHDSLILRTAYKAGDVNWINYFISKGAKLKGKSDGFEEACKSNKVEVLQHWIRNGGVVPKNPEYPCINMACLLGNFDMVKLLVENGVDLRNPARNGAGVSRRLGLKRTLKYLLDNNASLGNVCGYKLEYACFIEDVELVKMILDYYDGLEVLERKENTDKMSVEKAESYSNLSNKHSDCFEKYKYTKFLLERGKPIQSNDLLNAIKATVAVANIEILKLLLSYKIELNNDPEILRFFVRVGSVEVLKILLENGLSIKGDPSILKLAIKIKNEETTRLLLRHGAMVISDMYYLANNFNLDDIETLQLMLDYCPGISDGQYLIYIAIETNKLEAVKLLLKNTTELPINVSGCVLRACKSNNPEMLKLILEKGAKIDEGYESGVIQACENNNLEMLNVLFEKRPNLVLNRRYGLQEACDRKNVEMIKLLLKYGANTIEHIGLITNIANEFNDHELIEFCQNKGSGS